MKKTSLIALSAMFFMFTSHAEAACGQSETTYYLVKNGKVSKKTTESSSCGNMNGVFISFDFSENLNLVSGSKFDDKGETSEEYFQFNVNQVPKEPLNVARPKGVPSSFECYTYSEKPEVAYCVNFSEF